MTSEDNKRSCETCVFMTREKPNPNILETIMVCRRHPPGSVAIPTPQGIANMTTFPTVNPATWCFEYTAQTVKLALS